MRPEAGNALGLPAMQNGKECGFAEGELQADDVRLERLLIEGNANEECGSCETEEPNGTHGRKLCCEFKKGGSFFRAP